MAFLQQYLIYALIAAILVGGAAYGIQTYRLNSARTELAECRVDLEKERSDNTVNKTALAQLKTEGDVLQARLAQAQQDILNSERKHSEALKKLLGSMPPPVNGTCVEYVDWAKRVAIGRQK